MKLLCTVRLNTILIAYYRAATLRSCPVVVPLASWLEDFSKQFLVEWLRCGKIWRARVLPQYSE